MSKYMEVEATSELTINGRPLGVINQTDIETGHITGDASMREVAAQLSRWVDNSRAATGRTSMFDRGAYTPPDNPYDEMRSARHAVRYDSVVSSMAETTEAFAFQGVKWEGEDSDEADVFNQLSKDMNLDAVIRKMWREEYTYGQFVAAKMWGWQEYTVRGKTKKGNQRKRKFRIWAPLQIRILDSLKTVPAGVGPLGGETLCWQATTGEIGYYQASYVGDTIDPLMTTFFQGTYQPGMIESGELGQMGVDVSKLLVMNPDWVFRHTLTKPDYERFADIRLKSLFSLLDMKQHLMASDRALLIGSAKYILLIRKGEKDAPALPEEMQSLKENYNFIAKLPVIISDHRLSIDIIAPKTDFVLDPEKYGTIDGRILSRLIGSLTLPGGQKSTDNQDTLSAVVARVMENRRHMLKRTLEIEIGRAVVNHPKNAGVFETEPSLVFTPRNVALAMDAAYIQGLQALRTQREISRETILEYFGLDESTEAQRMEMEAEFYDDIFKTEIPYSKGLPNADVDQNLDTSDKTAGEGLALKLKPDGTLTAAPPGAPAKKAPAKKAAGTTTPAPGAGSTPAKKAPAKGPNGTPQAPSVSGARGGRPIGGGTSKKSPAAIAKPRTSSGAPKTPR
jgi:hypothetical protein